MEENQNNNKFINKNDNSIGAMWKRLNANQVEYYSMRITLNGHTYNLKCFMNGAKNEGDKKPDFLIYPSLNDGKNKINNNQQIE